MTANGPRLEFFYEFASTYSYLSAIGIEQLALDAGVAIAWRPFLLGPIFAAQGWTTSPFNLYPAKGRYMVRDIERIAKERGRTFVMPETFPANGLNAARIALCGEEPGWIGEFTRRVYEAQFEQRADIASLDVLSQILSLMNLDADTILDQSRSQQIKERLRMQSQRAAELGMFGAPSFIPPMANCSGATTGFNRHSPGAPRPSDETSSGRPRPKIAHDARRIRR